MDWNPGQAAVLIYGMPAQEPAGAALRACLEREHIRAVEVTAAQAGLTLGELVGLTPAGGFRFAPLPSEPAVVLYGLTDARMDRVLACLRRAGASPLKAMATPVNLGWTFSKLITELCAERAFYDRKNKSK